jgi:hypothetical protein
MGVSTVFDRIGQGVEIRFEVRTLAMVYKAVIISSSSSVPKIDDICDIGLRCKRERNVQQGSIITPLTMGAMRRCEDLCTVPRLLSTCTEQWEEVAVLTQYH